MWRPVCETPMNMQEGVDGHAMCPYWDFCQHYLWDSEPEVCRCYDEKGEEASFLRKGYFDRGMDYDQIVRQS